ncbi:MAG: hypothetical protein WD512_18575 [Candidatus Paceibacterota bacterium]
MAYKWEEKSLEKYGKEITFKLIEEQKKYEEKEKDNDCNHCGKGNQGAIIELQDGTPFIMRYGMWSYSEGVHRCSYCRKTS